MVSGVASIDKAKASELTFIAQEKYDAYLDASPAAIVLVRPDSPGCKRKCLIRVPNPYLAFVRVARELFHLGEPEASGIHDTAIIDATAEVYPEVSIGAYSIVKKGASVGKSTIIGANTTIGARARVGERCQIGNHVTIAHEVQIGDEVIIQDGTVVGSDGFGYVRDGEHYHKIPHLGTVVLEDRVEIGANCCIDRATFGVTRIRRGAKLDNLIHVAHNVEIGENTVIAAQVGISGSTRIGKNVTIAGQVGFVGHIEIGDGAIFGAQAGVTKSIPANITVSGYPAKEHRKAKREEAALRNAPEMLRRLRELEKKVSLLEEEKNKRKEV